MTNINIVKHIIEQNLVDFRSSIHESLEDIVEVRMVDLKKHIQAEDFSIPIDEETSLVFEAGRFKIVRARVRAGKILRRHKVATQTGFTMRGGRVHKMAPRERMNRRLSQKKAKYKRRSKKHQTALSTRKAMRKRRSIGL